MPHGPARRSDRAGRGVSLRVIPGGRGDASAPGFLVVGASEVVTMAGGLRAGSMQAEVARLTADDHADASSAPVVATWEDRIVAVGPRADLERYLEAEGFSLGRFARLDARGGAVTPGLVDPHTHLLFAGSREHELELRQRGAGYMEILAAGGGILSTVAATRAAGEDDLAAHGRRWLDEMLGHGTTTIEAKSGYGLDLATELRLLEVTHGLGREGPIDIVPTYLGAHAVPPEFRARPDGVEAYVRHILDEQLPGVAAQGRARFCDVFCEEGAFTADQSERILRAAAVFGMGLRLHADEIVPSGGAELAAELGAVSADHLAAPSEAGVDALADASAEGRPVVATLLPATTWFLMKDRHAPARTFIERGVPVAVGTDFNPGTSPTPSLPLAMTLACLNLRLTPDEALAAVTINAAYAIGMGEEIGSLEGGKAADLVIWNVPSSRQIPYWPAADLVRTVIKRGRIVIDNG
jgi:imidazolonepropionase